MEPRLPVNCGQWARTAATRRILRALSFEDHAPDDAALRQPGSAVKALCARRGVSHRPLAVPPRRFQGRPAPGGWDTADAKSNRAG